MTLKEETVVLPAATERYDGNSEDLATLQPGAASYFCVQPNARVRVDAIRVYGPKGARVSVVSVHLPSGDPITRLVPEERRSAALVTVDASKLLDDAARTVETSRMVGCTVRNDGREPAKLTVVAEGNFSMGDGPVEGKWWGLCALMPRGAPDRASTITIPAQGGAAAMVHPPYDTPLVGVRMRTSAPEGTVRVTSVQVANVNVLIGSDVPIEAFAYPDGAPLRSVVVDPACRFSVSLVSSHDQPVEVEAEYLILPRGVAKLAPRAPEPSEEAWEAARAQARAHGADVTLIEAAARVMSPDQAGLFAEGLDVETRQALVHHLVHKAGS